MIKNHLQNVVNQLRKDAQKQHQKATDYQKKILQRIDFHVAPLSIFVEKHRNNDFEIIINAHQRHRNCKQNQAHISFRNSVREQIIFCHETRQRWNPRHRKQTNRHSKSQQRIFFTQTVKGGNVRRTFIQINDVQNHKRHNRRNRVSSRVENQGIIGVRVHAQNRNEHVTGVRNRRKSQHSFGVLLRNCRYVANEQSENNHARHHVRPSTRHQRKARTKQAIKCGKSGSFHDSCHESRDGHR